MILQEDRDMRFGIEGSRLSRRKILSFLRKKGITIRCKILRIGDEFTVLNLIALGEKGEEKREYTEQDLAWDNIRWF